MEDFADIGSLLDHLGIKKLPGRTFQNMLHWL
jgi:hypothetical protein